MHKACRQYLNLNLKLGQEFYYQGLPFCVIDAVFSIGVKYESVTNVVQHVSQHFKKTAFRAAGSHYPPQAQQWRISELLAEYESRSSESMAESVYQNKCRTSSRSGILKAEAVQRFCVVLAAHQIETFQDMERLFQAPQALAHLQTQIQNVHGQSSGISFQYFLMLAGSEDFVKPDRMVQRFVERHTQQRSLTQAQIIAHLQAAHAQLILDFPDLTLRQLDYAIWSYERERKS